MNELGGTVGSYRNYLSIVSKAKKKVRVLGRRDLGVMMFPVLFPQSCQPFAQDSTSYTPRSWRIQKS